MQTLTTHSLVTKTTQPWFNVLAKYIRLKKCFKHEKTVYLVWRATIILPGMVAMTRADNACFVTL